MIYEAIAGERPFKGNNPRDILKAKERFVPSLSPNFLPEAPRDLATLCSRLLHPRPELRPSEEEVVERLALSTHALTEQYIKQLSPTVFVGRESHLATLREALSATDKGSSVVALVHGESGIGKSTLINRFLEECRARNDTLLLEGRCYEHEFVPFKAIDGIIDSLAQCLRRCSRQEVDALLPHNIDVLVRVFPVLEQIASVRNHSTQTTTGQHSIQTITESSMRNATARR